MNSKEKVPGPVEAREAFRKFAEQTTGWEVKDSNISKITVRGFSNRAKKTITTDICVGEELDYNFSDTRGEPVLAIFESTTYLVITPNRGGLRGMPYLFNQAEVFNVERGN